MNAAETAKEMAFKKAEHEYQREIANFNAATPQQVEVVVKMEGGIGILGQTFLPPIEADARLLDEPPADVPADPAQKPSEGLDPPSKPRVQTPADSDPSQGSFLNPFGDDE